MSVVGAMRNLAMTPNTTAVARSNHNPAVADAARAPSLLIADPTVQAAKPTSAPATQPTTAPTEAAGCFCPSRKFNQPVSSEAMTKAAPATASQYGQPRAPGISRTRSGSNARRLRRGPNDAARKIRSPPTAMSRTASPRAKALNERELIPNASAPQTARPRTTTEARRPAALARMRRHASPISARLAVRMAPAIDAMASAAPAGAGAIAKTAATPAIAKVEYWTWNPSITTAAATATAPEPARAIARLGSFPSSPRTGAATAATRATDTNARRVCWFDATTIGIKRYSTTIATTDHADCASADAAAGAVTAVCVIQELSGHRASRPAMPIPSRTEPTTSERTVQPGLVCRIGSSVVR